MSTSATIAAIATGPSAGGVGVIRLSGPEAMAAARRVVRGWPEVVTPRHAYFVRFVDAQGVVLDEGLALYFAAPKSFTGEEVVELHAHGAPKLLSMLLGELLQHSGVRLATAGEFTRRAYVSGRMALTRAEAVADLIAAESEAQVRAAAAQLSGELSARLEAVHAPLLALQADVEGALDFPEEAEGAEADAAGRLEVLLVNVRALLSDARRGALVRRGARVVLYGPVNAGKSTLFNALVGASRALVDAEPGTTRDTLEARVEWAGLAVTLVDTAGLREGAGRLEAMGIERTREALRGADVAVLVLPRDATEAQRAEWVREVQGALLVEVRGKADLLGARGRTANELSSRALASTTLAPHPNPLPFRGEGEQAAIAVSGLTGLGLETLRTTLTHRLGDSSAVTITSERHLRALELIDESLTRARQACDVATLEIVAGEVGLAIAALAEITGADASTELLDAIFQRFCIGK